MSASIRDPWFQFFRIGMQYYIAGRAASRCWLVPVSGNLLHHAVEMFLKGDLSRTHSLKKLKDQYGHRLPETWTAFKDGHPDDDLVGFDGLIAQLDRFEKIRYPDDYLKNGALMTVGWGTPNEPVGQQEGPKVPEYCLFVNEVDSLMSRLFIACRINPAVLVPIGNREALRGLAYLNEAYAGWGLEPPISGTS